MYNTILDSGGSLKAPNAPMPNGSGDSIAAYMKNFPFHIKIKLGRVYTAEFKEFNAWCESNLGVKYKDWFITSQSGPSTGNYTLWLKDTKKSMFLTLKFSESIDSHTLSEL
jgi:hypothetical protein